MTEEQNGETGDSGVYMGQDAARNAALIDLKRIARLERRFGAARCEVLAEEAVRQISHQNRVLKGALASGNLPELRQSAEQIKRMARRAGLQRLSHVLADFERLLDIWDRPALFAVAARMDRVLDQSLLCLTQGVPPLRNMEDDKP